ncbi:flavodoxin domain-containing protein [Streptosporangium sp. NPDC051022]|uniref:flavodoxin domain-containing protein n=1 Tax=Streptosporangium sp. NPDC051022 TaxID=3155752 RepID=UPI003433720F
MKVLVAYGSKRGSTREIAEWIGRVLTEEGLDAEVRPAAGVRDVDAYDAVVLGGAVYFGRWHRHARALARRCARQLAERPVWLFSSGPLQAIGGRDVPPPAAAERARRRIGARENVTFGGCLRADARGFPAATMAKTAAGDFREPERVRAWARDIAYDLKAAGLAR